MTASRLRVIRAGLVVAMFALAGLIWVGALTDDEQLGDVGSMLVGVFWVLWFAIEYWRTGATANRRPLLIAGIAAGAVLAGASFADLIS